MHTVMLPWIILVQNVTPLFYLIKLHCIIDPLHLTNLGQKWLLKIQL